MFYIVIDDEPTIRKIAGKMLQTICSDIRKEHIFLIDDGIKLKKHIKIHGWPKLIFMDIVMPNSNGQRIVRQIRSQNKDVCVFAMTGNVEGDLSRYDRDGFNGIIGKPFNNTSLKMAWSYYRNGGSSFLKMA